MQNQRGYICYLNSAINGLLTLNNFQKLIPFMETSLKNFFLDILCKQRTDLEPLRNKLNQFNGEFPIDRHSDPIEAIQRLLEMIDMDAWYQNTLIDFVQNQICNECGNQDTYSIKQNEPNIMFLELSKKETLQDIVNEYLENKKTTTIINTFCSKCKTNKEMSATITVKTNKVIIIRICRFDLSGNKNHKNIIPNNTISLCSKKYQLKSSTFSKRKK